MGAKFIEYIKRLKSIADIGLLYSHNDYDRERYHELHQISLQLLQEISGHSIENLQAHFPLEKDYPTAKVDIRGLLLSPEKEILFIRESTDGKWSLPGGWADVGFSPKETIIREFKEETGLDVEAVRLLAVFDKKMHPHPPQPFYIYKMIFHCEAVSTAINKGFDVLDVRYFGIGQLPELSEDRILKSQIEQLYEKILSGNTETCFD